MTLFNAKNPIRIMKMTGSGNDFIVIDNRFQHMNADHCGELVRLACRRKLSVGADGFIFIEKDAEVDFRWRFFNADGSEAEMCGNGARCAARFAYLKGIVPKTEMSFRTLAGIIEAEIMGERVKIRVTPPHGLKMDISLQVENHPFLLHFIDTGVPHSVHFVADQSVLETLEVFRLGRAVRYHPHFQPSGTNANFAAVQDQHHLAIRTYERGVEAETLACGTGSIAAVLIAAAKSLVISPVEVLTRSGETLTIHFEQPTIQGAPTFSEVYLEGDAKVVYEAILWDETLRE